MEIKQPYIMTGPSKKDAPAENVRAFFIGSIYSMWLLHLHSTVEMQPFSPAFPLAGATAKAFFRLSPWSFKEKASTIFYNTAFLLWKSFKNTRLFHTS